MKVNRTMKNYEWLLNALIMLDELAEEMNQSRLCDSTFNAPDGAVINVEGSGGFKDPPTSEYLDSFRLRLKPW
jgi:hypothetical protein